MIRLIVLATGLTAATLVCAQPSALQNRDQDRDQASESRANGQIDTADKADKTQADTVGQLSIKGIPFQAITPILGQVEEHPGYTRQIVRVQWRNGDPIDLFIVKPVGRVLPPVTLFLYSWPGDTDRFFSDAWCRTVTQRGVAAVGFVSALTGNRYHDRPWKEWFVSELPEALTDSVQDVQMILNYIETRNDLDSSRIGMFGQGSGGTIALLAGSVEPRLKAVDVIDPWGDWPNWFATSPVVPASQHEQLNRLEFLKPLKALDPFESLPKLGPDRVRVQEVSPNPVNPALVKSALHAAAAGLTFIEYTTEEDYRHRAMQDGLILSWLTLKLTQ